MNITFSDSNQYFQDTSLLQSQVDFVNAMDIDVFVQQSFSAADNELTVTGGYLKIFNKDHLIDDKFICYKIEKTNKQPLRESDGAIKFSIKDREFLVLNFVQGLIQGSPLVIMLILAIVSLFLPPTLAAIARRISIIGIVITYMFFAWKIIRTLYKTITAKGIDYNGVNVLYEKNDDILRIHKEQINLVKELNKNLNIYKGVLFNGVLYLKQIIKRPTLRSVIKNVFVSHNDDKKTIDDMIQKGVDFIFSPAFIQSPNPGNNVQP